MTEIIYVVGPDGKATGDQYYWNTVEECIFGPEEDCWIDNDDEKVEDVRLPMGTGLYLNLFTEGATIQYAGEVLQDVQTNSIPTTGFSVIGNSTPVEIDLNDLRLIDACGDGMTEIIYVVGPDGKATGDQYYWNTAEECIFGPEEDCWIDNDDEKVEGVKLAPGEGLYINLFTEGASFTLPAPM